jgi:DNA-binding protein
MMPTKVLARIISVKANVHEVQVKQSGRNQNKARAVLRAAEQVQDRLDGEI